MNISLITLGQRIARKRKKRIKTQTQLASKVGISDRTLGKIENGFDMKLSQLIAIADALEVNVFELLASEEIALASIAQDNKRQIIEHLDAIKQLIDK